MPSPRDLLAEQWPFFGLTLTTPRLTLRYVDDERAAALMDLAASAGVHDVDVMPFTVPWTRSEPPRLQQQGLQHHWLVRAQLTAQEWDLPFAVYEGDRLVGSQSIGAKSFLVTGTVSTGSWLARAEQGRGIGKDMRAAVLHLGFAGLGAERAETLAFGDNASSIGVTRHLGYAENGCEVVDREGKPVRQLRFVLERAGWQTRRRSDVEILGLEDCLGMLGLPRQAHG